MRYFAIAFVLIAGCTAQPKAPTATTQPAVIPVVIRLSDPNAKPEWGITVVAPHELSASKNADGRFELQLMNNMPEEMFVQVSGFDSLGGKLEKEGSLRAGGGSYGLSAHQRYELLHAGFKLKDGRIVTCGCGMAWIKAKFDVDDLKKWVGATGEITIYVSGYRRSNGESFQQFLDLPIKIVE